MCQNNICIINNHRKKEREIYSAKPNQSHVYDGMERTHIVWIGKTKKTKKKAL